MVTINDFFYSYLTPFKGFYTLLNLKCIFNNKFLKTLINIYDNIVFVFDYSFLQLHSILKYFSFYNKFINFIYSIYLVFIQKYIIKLIPFTDHYLYDETNNKFMKMSLFNYFNNDYYHFYKKTFIINNIYMYYYNCSKNHNLFFIDNQFVNNPLFINSIDIIFVDDTNYTITNNNDLFSKRKKSINFNKIINYSTKNVPFIVLIYYYLYLHNINKQISYITINTIDKIITIYDNITLNDLYLEHY